MGDFQNTLRYSPKYTLAYPYYRIVKGGGGGGGGHPDYFFVKLDFEIAVDQQTRARDRTFKGTLDSECPPVPAGQPRSYLVNSEICRAIFRIWPLKYFEDQMQKYLKMAEK